MTTPTPEPYDPFHTQDGLRRHAHVAPPVPAVPVAAPVPLDAPVGFEFPADPEADLPVPARDGHAVVAPSSWAAVNSANPLANSPAPHVAPTAPPTFDRLDAQPPVPAPVASVGPTTQVEEVTAEDVTALLGFNPDQVVTGQPAIDPSYGFQAPVAAPSHAAPVAVQQSPSAYLAPEVSRPSIDVPVVDPRGQFLPPPTAEGLRNTVTPKEALAVVEGRPEIERLLTGLVKNGGSDMHLTAGEIPRYRVSGALLPIAGEETLTTPRIERMLEEILTEKQWHEFKSRNELDFAYQMSTRDGAALSSRFRGNLFRSLGETGAVFRVIPEKIVTLDQLGVPNAVKQIAERPRGLFLVTGPTGSGKSTTLAALVDLINETREERIFTLEDPVEFTHRSKKCLVSHREVGTDTESFTEGLRRVRREDPDIILIGEMRDYETIDAAIEAADTGHLVLATLHTNSAPETISRIINSFPAERQEQIRITLSSCLLGVMCQTLVPSATSERGRILAAEIMIVTPGISNNIRENDIPAISNALTDRETGSQSLDAHLVELIRENKITKKEALKKASSPEALDRQLGNYR